MNLVKTHQAFEVLMKALLAEYPQLINFRYADGESIKDRIAVDVLIALQDAGIKDPILVTE